MSALRSNLLKVLANAGFAAGTFHRGGGKWSDYEPAETGPVILKEIVASTTRDSLDNEPRFSAHHSLFQLAVDHAGKGRKEAMAGYEAALRAAGYDVKVAKLRFYKKKLVIWIPGYWLHHGDGPVPAEAAERYYKDFEEEP